MGATRATFVYRAAGHEWSFSGFSEVYIHPNVFNNSEVLFDTVAHEMIHVSQNLSLMGTVYNDSLSNVYRILKEGNAYDFTCKSFGYQCGAFGTSEGNVFNLYKRTYPDLAKLLNWRNYRWTHLR